MKKEEKNLLLPKASEVTRWDAKLHEQFFGTGGLSFHPRNLYQVMFCQQQHLIFLGEFNIAEESTSNSSDIHLISLQPGSPTWLIPVQLENSFEVLFPQVKWVHWKCNKVSKAEEKNIRQLAATLWQSAGVAIVQAAVGSVQAVLGSVQAVVGGGSISLTV